MINLGILLVLFCGFSQAMAGERGSYDVSFSQGALAANAGGQDAMAVRVHHEGRELHGYINPSLSTGGRPLVGAGYGIRFDACSDCFWKAFVQSGLGLSTAGPYLELDWGLAVPIIPIWLPRDPFRYVPQLRIDFATHLIFSNVRPSVWSYPLWLGFSIPF
jgi:hypothetical protein